MGFSGGCVGDKLGIISDLLSSGLIVVLINW